jgi:hypothetical protein
MYSPAWPHREIKEVLPNIFYVTGTNFTTFNDIEYRHSRNMIVVRDNNTLSLINAVRLNEDCLSQLDALGKVRNVIRIGAFHGRDDAFYTDRYQAKQWALAGMPAANVLTTNGAMPIADCSLFQFETTQYPEAILHIAKEGGILITCDSIKNWIAADEFFSNDSAKRYEELKYFGVATISRTWIDACNIQAADLEKIKSLTFKHLISAHGEPLLNNAHDAVTKSISSLDFSVRE